MPLSLAESQAASEIAQLLYDFLPGTPHPYADSGISFPGVAHSLGLSSLWRGGSKLPALTTLLTQTLDTQRERFCDLVLAIVRQGLIYRTSKHNPITREEIQALNELMLRVRFKVPELWDPDFLASLPTEQANQEQESPPKHQADANDLKTRVLELDGLEPKQRGFAFERFLNEMFAVYGLDPHGAFRLVGEQIDGSFQVDTDTYLLEAKWHQEPVGQADLLVFREKVESKSFWSRGLFVSYSGFTPDGLTAFSKGRSTNIIGMSGQDLYFILNGQLSLAEAIRSKARRAAETGDFYVCVYEFGA